MIKNGMIYEKLENVLYIKGFKEFVKKFYSPSRYIDSVGILIKNGIMKEIIYDGYIFRMENK